MPSIRFIVIEIVIITACIIGLRIRDKIPASAMPILILCWVSLATDLFCYALKYKGLPYESVKHLYTFFEFFLEGIFISGVTKNALLKQIITIVLPLYFAGWYSVQFLGNVITEDDTAAQIISHIIIIIGIVWTLYELTRNLSFEMHTVGKHSSLELVSQIVHQIWQQAIGKMFIGLLLFNFFGLVIYELELLIPKFQYLYYHSATDIIKNTCFTLAFLQFNKGK
jgi:hypothetical protein